MGPFTPYTRTWGPFTMPSWSGVYLTYYKEQHGVRQKPPYDVDTTYSLVEYKRLSGEHLNADDSFWGADSPPEDLRRAQVRARNRARETWLDRLGDGSSFGATVTAERKETWALFVNSAGKALLAAKQVKNLQFAKAAQTLGLPYREVRKRKRVGFTWETRYDPRQGRKRRVRVPHYQNFTTFDWGTGRDHLKTLANGWLMYSYGVKPLAQDCYNAIDVLTRKEPYGVIKGRWAKEDVFLEWPIDTFDIKIKVRQKARVVVTNYDLLLLDRTGFLNPFQWALEAVPFSFVIDWFSNLSQVVSAMNELGGVRVENPLISESHKELWVRDGGTDTLRGSANRYRYVRREGLIRPELQFNWERFSWQRGLNAISLLVGFLKGSRD